MIGTVVGGRFRIVRLLGQGGMGSVWEAQHETLPRRFAVKLLRPELTERDEFLERFRREAIAAAAIDHPNVIYITDFGRTAGGSLYIVMEYLAGTGLHELIHRQGRMTLDRALSILAQVADALSAAHACDVVHRDMKPENILLLEKHGRRDVVKLLDFGIARLITAEFAGKALTSAGSVIGTAEYMAPEQALGKPCDTRADIYAFGCLTHELIIGEPPFVGPPGLVMGRHVHDPVAPPSSRLRDQALPAEIDALVLRCLAKDPEERYQTALELRQDVLKVQTLLFGGHAAPAHAGRLEPPAPSERAPPLFGPDEGAIETRRQAYHDLLRELAMAALKSEDAPAGVAETLDRVLATEQQAATLIGSVALVKQDLARRSYEHGQVETQLRHAVTDLRLERDEVERERTRGGEAVPLLQARLTDLAFQIEELQKRLDECVEQHARESTALAEKIAKAREQRRQSEALAAALLQRLASHLDAWRETASAREPKAVDLFRRLDKAREIWQQALRLSSSG